MARVWGGLKFDMLSTSWSWASTSWRKELLLELEEYTSVTFHILTKGRWDGLRIEEEPHLPDLYFCTKKEIQWLTICCIDLIWEKFWEAVWNPVGPPGPGTMHCNVYIICRSQCFVYHHMNHDGSIYYSIFAILLHFSEIFYSFD